MLFVILISDTFVGWGFCLTGDVQVSTVTIFVFKFSRTISVLFPKSFAHVLFVIVIDVVGSAMH